MIRPSMPGTVSFRGTHVNLGVCRGGSATSVSLVAAGAALTRTRFGRTLVGGVRRSRAAALACGRMVGLTGLYARPSLMSRVCRPSSNQGGYHVCCTCDGNHCRIPEEF